MNLSLSKLFEFDSFKYGRGELQVTIEWKDYMNKESFLNKVNDVMETIEDEPIQINYDGSSVELLYQTIGIDMDGIH